MSTDSPREPSAVERDFDVLLEHASDAILMVSQAGEILRANRRCHAVFGYPEGALIGLPVDDLLPGRFRQSHAEHRSRFVSAPTPRPMASEMDLFGCRADGSEFPVEISLSPVAVDDQTLVIAFLNDISGRRHMEEQLRESRRRLSALIGNLPGIAYRGRLERSRPVEFISDGCMEVTGYPPEAFLTNKVSYMELIHPDDQPRVWEHMQAAAAAGGRCQLRYRLMTIDGDERHVWEQGSCVFDDEGQPVAVEGFITDVTDEQRLQQQLEQAAKMAAIGQLAGNVAHEVNNPIGIISAKAQLLLSNPASTLSEKEATELQKMIEQCDRLAKMTRGLLDFSRPSLGEKRPVSIHLPIQEALSLVTDRAQKHQIATLEELFAREPQVLGNGNELQQVFLNLFLNAIDAMRDQQGGRLTVSTRNMTTAGGTTALLVEVSDTGDGVEPEQVATIFEPFFSTKAGGGTGLGLSICLGLLRSHNAEIEVEPVANGGTRFLLRFPVWEGD